MDRANQVPISLERGSGQMLIKEAVTLHLQDSFAVLFQKMDELLLEETRKLNEKREELRMAISLFEQDKAEWAEVDRERLMKDMELMRIKAEELEVREKKLEVKEEELNQREKYLEAKELDLEGDENLLRIKQQNLEENVKELELNGKEENRELPGITQEQGQDQREQELWTEIRRLRDVIQTQEEKAAEELEDVKLSRDMNELEVTILEKYLPEQTQLARKIMPGRWYLAKQFCMATSEFGTKKEEAIAKQFKRLIDSLDMEDEKVKPIIKFEVGMEASVGIVGGAETEVSTLLSASGLDLRTSWRNLTKGLVKYLRKSIDEQCDRTQA